MLCHTHLNRGETLPKIQGSSSPEGTLPFVLFGAEGDRGRLRFEREHRIFQHGGNRTDCGGSLREDTAERLYTENYCERAAAGLWKGLTD